MALLNFDQNPCCFVGSLPKAHAGELAFRAVDDAAEYYFRVEVRAYSGLLRLRSWLVTTAYTLLMRGGERNLNPARVSVVRLRDGLEVWHRNCYEAATVRATRERMEERLRSRTAAVYCREYNISDAGRRLTTQRKLAYAGAAAFALLIVIVAGVHVFGSHGPATNSPQYQAGYQAGQAAFQQEASQNANAAAGASGDSYCQTASRDSSAFDAGCLQGWSDAQSLWSGGG